MWNLTIIMNERIWNDLYAALFPSQPNSLCVLYFNQFYIIRDKIRLVALIIHCWHHFRKVFRTRHREMNFHNLVSRHIHSHKRTRIRQFHIIRNKSYLCILNERSHCDCVCVCVQLICCFIFYNGSLFF